MIYELRIYDVIPGKLPALNERFAKITMRGSFHSCIGRLPGCDLSLDTGIIPIKTM